MTDQEALRELIYVAPLSEEDKARFLALLPSMTPEEVVQLGRVLAKQELTFAQKLDHAIELTTATIDAYQEKATSDRTPDAVAE